MRPEIHLVVAARPNLPKIAAVWHALAGTSFCTPVLLHTGQHWDDAMFGALLRDLELPTPHIALGVTGGSHAELTAATMLSCEKTWRVRRPPFVVVPGDVDGALAATLAAKKLGIRVVHLEAGLRCGDMTMAEEINRRMIDAVADALWAPDATAMHNLHMEGRSAVASLTGNAMIATLERTRLRWRRPDRVGAYGVLTLHRAANVDTAEALGTMLHAVQCVAQHMDFIWPLHPRTQARISAFGCTIPSRVQVCDPLGYLDFMGLVAGASAVVTDSGGVQEETTHLGIPCLTLRPSTERPITITHGTNVLVRPDTLEMAFLHAVENRTSTRSIPGWDADAGMRMAHALQNMVNV